MKLTRRLLFVVGAASLIGGCSTPAYRAPSGLKTPVLFVNHSPENFLTLALYVDDYDCAEQFFIAFFGTVTTSQQNLTRRPFQTFTYSYTGLGGGALNYCGGTYTFPVDDSSKYRVSVQNGSTCMTLVEKQSATGDAGDWTPVTAVKRILRTGLVMDGGYCIPAKEYIGSSLLVTPRGQ